MGIFSKEIKLSWFDEFELDKRFLNLHLIFEKTKFKSRSKFPTILFPKGESLAYDFNINNFELSFEINFREISSHRIYCEYYDSDLMSIKAKDGFLGHIGLPNLKGYETMKHLYPFNIVEISSKILFKKWKYDGVQNLCKNSYLRISYQENNSWTDEFAKDFDKCFKIMILNTKKTLNLLKKKPSALKNHNNWYAIIGKLN